MFIQQTEALTVIDVNSGKFVSSATQDETILKTNIEAVHEIARQLRLRNIGGMVIVDFIDMNSRVDKLAMMEELEIALEPDKAKPQVGQLSDLGLVELTRHRQGQSLAEVFAKKCPHCQGNGFIMEDIKFASPTAEGEYRAKSAKIKLPLSGFKKNNNQKQGNRNNRPQNEREVEENLELQPQEMEISIQVENPSMVVTEETEILENNKKSRSNKRGRFNKGKVKELIKKEEVLETSENVLPQNAEIELTVEPKAEAPAEVEATDAPAEPQKKSKRPNRGQGKSRGKRTSKTQKGEDEE